MDHYDWEQPTVPPAPPEPTKVTKMNLTSGVLTLTVARASCKEYGVRSEPPPAMTDVPNDYIAAINQWIAEGFR